MTPSLGLPESSRRIGSRHPGHGVVRIASLASCVLALASTTAFAQPCKNHYILEGDAVCRPAPANAWMHASALKAGRENHTALLLHDGTVLVVGGEGEQPLAEAEIYDPASDTWSPAGSLATPRTGHTATVLADGRVLVVGGFPTRHEDCCLALAAAEIFDPATRTWTHAGELNDRRAAHSATLLHDGRVLIAGGYGFSDDPMASAELFDPTTITFQRTGRLVASRYGHSATLLQNGMVLVARGSNDADLITTLRSAELYDPATGRWMLTGRLAKGSVYHTATAMPEGTVIVTGGYGGGMGRGPTFAISERYVPSTGTWEVLPDMHVARYAHSSVAIGDGRLLVTGGVALLGTMPRVYTVEFDDVEELDVASMRWTERDNLTTPRRGHTATILGDGRVFVVGGRFYDPLRGSRFSPSAAWYRP